MAWQIPQSQTSAATVVTLAADDDSVFVATGVTVASTGGFAVVGSGSGHQAVIYGTIVGLSGALNFAGNDAVDSGESVTVNPGGELHAIDGVGIILHAKASLITNNGLISAETGNGIFFSGQSAVTFSKIDNGGTIEADIGIIRGVLSTEAMILNNSGLILADTAYDSGGASATDLITNTGRIVGDILLYGGGDTYNGASGRLSGEVHGGNGADIIIGGIDNDVFFGDAGGDTLTGGLGRDLLTGGTEQDFFDFNSVKESVKGSNRDQILDFNHGEADKIDLKTIDAQSGGGNQAFKFIGKQAFHDVKGELRYIDKGASCIVQGDINGDGKADFEIFVKVGSLAKGDFLL